jgi:hypothetical protein
MKTEDARNILMLAAVEETDEGGIVLSAKERHEASREAGSPLPANPGRAREEAFLAVRAAALLERLVSRFPSSAWLDPAASSHPASHPGLVALFLLSAAVVGYLTNELGPEKRINILSFPLLGILVWSAVVYLREAWLFFSQRPPVLLERWFEWAGPRPETGEKDDPAARVLATAKRLFEKRWSRLSAPVTAARLKSLLHLAAFVLAAAAIGGMYVKGLANEYRAVWESTFLTDSTSLRGILRVVLGPAASLSGESLPTPEELEAIRGADAPGENAARWIHWYALSIALFVLAPRAILAILWRVRSASLARSLPYRENAPRYYARLLATSSGSARAVALVPYAFDPDEPTKRGLVRRLEDEFGASVEAVWLPMIAFGEEESFVLAPTVAGAEILPVFSFAATPEREAHLAAYRTLSGLAPNPVRFVLLEAGAFDRKSRDFADAANRRAAREEAWKRLFADESIALLLQPETSSTASAPA